MLGIYTGVSIFNPEYNAFAPEHHAFDEPTETEVKKSVQSVEIETRFPSNDLQKAISTDVIDFVMERYPVFCGYNKSLAYKADANADFDSKVIRINGYCFSFDDIEAFLCDSERKGRYVFIKF